MLWELSQLYDTGVPMDCRGTKPLPEQRHFMSIMLVLAMEYLGGGACAAPWKLSKEKQLPSVFL